jgi:hypothetical protein
MLPLENTIGAAGLQTPRLIHWNSPFLSIVVLEREPDGLLLGYIRAVQPGSVEKDVE